MYVSKIYTPHIENKVEKHRCTVHENVEVDAQGTCIVPNGLKQIAFRL